MSEAVKISDNEIADIMDNSSYCFLGVDNSIIKLDEIDGVEGILVKIHKGYPAVEVYKDDGTGDGDGVIKHYEGPLTVAVIDDAISQYLDEYCVFNEGTSVKEKTKLKEGLVDAVRVTDYEGGDLFEITLEDIIRDISGHDNITLSLDDGQAYMFDASGDEETAKYAFDAIKGGRKVQATVYYDEDGEEVSGDDSWEDEEDLFCYIPEGYEA